MLEEVWEQFLNCISIKEHIKNYTSKTICGVQFIYIEPIDEYKDEKVMKNLLIDCSKQFTSKYTITYKVDFVRFEDETFIFRHRFFVPNKKMFCCGNCCVNCTRLQGRN